MYFQSTKTIIFYFNAKNCYFWHGF